MFKKLDNQIYVSANNHVYHNDILQRFEFKFVALDIFLFSKRKKDKYKLRTEINTVIIEKSTPQVQALLKKLEDTNRSEYEINLEISKILSLYIESYFDYAYENKFEFISLEKKIFQNIKNLKEFFYTDHNEIVSLYGLKEEYQNEETFINEFTKSPY